MTAKREQSNYDRLIGRIDQDYIYLDYTFDHGGGFRGATGTRLHPVTPEEAEERRNDFDCDGELWQMAVEAGNTTLGLEEWRQQVLAIDGDDAVFDLSSSSIAEDLRSRLSRFGLEFELVECVGGGRCFHPDMKWDKLFNRRLWQEILKFERERLQ